MEATVTGNIAVQLMTLGEFENLSQVRQAVAASSNTKTYLPADCKKWDEVYERFCNIRPDLGKRAERGTLQ